MTKLILVLVGVALTLLWQWKKRQANHSTSKPPAAPEKMSGSSPISPSESSPPTGIEEFTAFAKAKVQEFGLMTSEEVEAFASKHEHFTFYDIAMESDKYLMLGELVLESVTSDLDYESLYEEDIFPWLMNLYPGTYSVKLHPAENEEVVPIEINWGGNRLVVDHQIDMGRWHDQSAITSVVSTIIEGYDPDGRFIEVEDGLLWLNKSVDQDDFWQCFTGG